jgi:hypothetical protein
MEAIPPRSASLHSAVATAVALDLPPTREETEGLAVEAPVIPFNDLEETALRAREMREVQVLGKAMAAAVVEPVARQAPPLVGRV